MIAHDQHDTRTLNSDSALLVAPGSVVVTECGEAMRRGGSCGCARCSDTRPFSRIWLLPRYYSGTATGADRVPAWW